MVSQSKDFIYKIKLFVSFLISSKKTCRDYIKSKNSYFVMRELYNWEKDDLAKESIYKLIQVLISDEPESHLENLHEVDIPETLSQKFYEIEQKSLEKNFED